MPAYLSPGVYVEEVPSAVQAIAGVGTSTAGFIGLIPDDVIVVPPGPVYDITDKPSIKIKSNEPLDLRFYPVMLDSVTVMLLDVDKNGILTGKSTKYNKQENLTLENNPEAAKATLTINDVTLKEGKIEVTYKAWAIPVVGESIGDGEIVDRKNPDDTVTPTGKLEFKLAAYPVSTKVGTFTIYQSAMKQGSSPPEFEDRVDVTASVTLVNDHRAQSSRVVFNSAPPEGAKLFADYHGLPANLVVHKEKVGVGDGLTLAFKLANSDVQAGDDGVPRGLFQVRVGNYEDKDNGPQDNVKIQNGQVTFPDGRAPQRGKDIWADYMVYPTFRIRMAGDTVNDAKLCTSFGDFRRTFGDFSTDRGQSLLAHAVYGFFHNGGTRCYVARMTAVTEIDKVLPKFAAIDEIALVAAPGVLDDNVTSEVVRHCKIATQDRFAILDSLEEVGEELTLDKIKPPPYSDYAAFYFPWIQVFDPATKTMAPKGDGRIFVPPSGHMAGIYARVDTTRGVHKAPANEPVLGALGLRQQISKAQQDGLNPHGINCIRELNGSIRVWGARTLGGDANGEWRYINVRRTFLYLRESIDEGTQWAVFEPNDQNLWAKITRNITAFLTNVWRSGALFGSTTAEAFYVKCNAETNPPELREIGQVVTEIGVAVVRPAEFVIFRISQWQPPTA